MILSKKLMSIESTYKKFMSIFLFFLKMLKHHVDSINIRNKHVYFHRYFKHIEKLQKIMNKNLICKVNPKTTKTVDYQGFFICKVNPQ